MPSVLVAISWDMAIGMLYAFRAYKRQFLDKEPEVNQALAELKITRVVIAHRPDTIRSADRVIMLRDG